MFSAADLRRRWESLQHDSERLPNKLRSVASSLRKEGALPDWNFLDELTFYSQRFRDLRESMGCQNDRITLQELNDQIESLARCEQAEHVLNQAEQLQGDIPDNVANVIAEARHAITSRNEETISGLIDGTHALVPLVQLCDSECHLEDDAWELARQKIVQHFGNQVATAVIRGRISIESQHHQKGNMS